MNKSKLEKQPSEMIPLNLDNTPMNNKYEMPMDQFSFTLKSKDDVFGNNHNFGSFGDYEIADFTCKGDKTQKNVSSSPMTRRQAQRKKDMLNDKIKMMNPEQFKIDLEGMSHCP
jgi:hypothetical protein